MRSRLLASASVALIVASACGSDNTPTTSPIPPSVPIVPTTPTVTATSNPSPSPESSLSSRPPAPTATATPVEATSPVGCGCPGSTIYLLKNATDFDYYDPQRVYTQEDEAFFGATIMRSLVAFKYSVDPAQADTLAPDMATDIGTTNADATTWTYTLRDGLSWQDGSPVKCDDVKYGVSRTFATDVINGGPNWALKYLAIPTAGDGTSQYKGPFSGEGQDLFDQAVHCDGNTITFHLNQTVPDFAYVTTVGFGAVPNPVDHPGVDTVENYVGDAVWSDGPYQITSYVPDEGGSLILDRNPNWNQASDDYRAAYPDEWEVDFGIDLKAIDQRLMQSTGNDAFAIDYGGIQPAYVPDVFTDSHSAKAAFAGRAFSSYNSYTRYYWIDTKKVPNRDIRAAMLVALDRDAIRQNAGGSFVGDFADGALTPNIGPDYTPTGLWQTTFGEVIPDNGDPTLARSLIAQSGVEPPTLEWGYSVSPTADTNAQIVKQSLENAGFKVKLHPVEVHYCYSEAYGCFEYDGDFGSTAWAPDWPNASTVIPSIFTNEGPWNKSKVDDSSGIPDWTAQVNDALTTTDRDAQALKWQTLNKEAVEQAWIIPLFFSLSQNMAGTEVGGAYRWTPYASWPYAQLYAKSPG